MFRTRWTVNAVIGAIVLFFFVIASGESWT